MNVISSIKEYIGLSLIAGQTTVQIALKLWGLTRFGHEHQYKLKNLQKIS